MHERTVLLIRGKVSEAIKTLRSALGVTQLELAVKLDIGGHSIAHFESGRLPDAVTTARLCRAAHEAGRDDLADIFAVAMPGVAEGLVVPVWWVRKQQRQRSGSRPGMRAGNGPTLHSVRPTCGETNPAEKVGIQAFGRCENVPADRRAR
jgi:transcriptional regulator with XRE-family HTH domain